MRQLHGAIVCPLGIHDAHLAHQTLHRRPVNGASTPTGRRVQRCALINPWSRLPHPSTVFQLQLHFRGIGRGTGQDI